MISYTSGERRVTGIDYDEEKIRVALNGFGKPKNLDFIHADVTSFAFGPQDAIILSDVLHYLPEKEQKALLVRCIRSLRKDGVILLREGVRDGKRHSGTKFTEFMSTGIAFNRTSTESRQLWFLSEEMIRDIAGSERRTVERISEKKGTSNVLFIIK
jgi:SAM-dependent methyltransferase